MHFPAVMLSAHESRSHVFPRMALVTAPPPPPPSLETSNVLPRFSTGYNWLHVFLLSITRPVALDNNLIYCIPFLGDTRKASYEVCQSKITAHLLLSEFIISCSFQNLRLKYYQEDDIIDEMTLAKGTKDM